MSITTFLRLDALLELHMNDDGTLRVPLDELKREITEHCEIPYHARLWLKVARIKPSLNNVKLLLRNVDFIDLFRDNTKRNEQNVLNLAIALDNEVIVSLYKNAYRRLFITVCERGCTNIVKAMLEHFGKEVAVTRDVMFLVVMAGRSEVLRLLLPFYGGNITELLRCAWDYRDAESTKVLIIDGRVSFDGDIDIDCKTILGRILDADLIRLLAPQCRMTYYITGCALIKKDIESIKALLECSTSEWSATHLSCCSTDIATMILQCKNITLTSSVIWDMLSVKMNEEVVKILLQDDRTPRHEYIRHMVIECLSKSNNDILKLLLPPYCDKSHLETILYNAISYDRMDLAKLILSDERINPMVGLLGVLRSGKLEYIKLLLSHPRLDWSLIRSTDYNVGMAEEACESYNVTSVKYLITKGLFCNEALREVLTWSIDYSHSDLASLVMKKLGATGLS